MKYHAKQYAAALLEALKDKLEIKQKEIIRRFLQTLTKNNDWAKLNSIVKEAEKKYLKDAGLKKVYLEAASPVSGELQKEIEEILGKADLNSGKKIYFLAKTNPALLAGLKILINDELLIDASARNKIDRMFVK